MKRAALTILVTWACAALVALLVTSCGRDERRPTQGWPAGIGGEKRPGGEVPPSLPEPKGGGR